MINKKIYFASDLHFGLYPPERSLEREKMFVQWLSDIKPMCSELYLVGDIFDFWYEHKRVVPKGFTRFFSKIIEFTESGIPVHFFSGNHDIWMKDYLPKELGITLHHKPLRKTINGKKFYIAHGDGLGKGDWGFKFIKSLFTNRLLQWCFSRLHPNFSLSIGQGWAKQSGQSKSDEVKFYGEDKELLIIYAKELLKNENIDYFIFGHRHLLLSLKLNDALFIQLGDWIHHFSWAEFDGESILLKNLNTK